MSELEHYDNEIYAIEIRIRQLAAACSMDIDNNLAITTVKKGIYIHCLNGDHYSHTLLRELLLLRDYVTLHCGGELGRSECNEILEEVEAKLRQHEMFNDPGTE